MSPTGPESSRGDAALLGQLIRTELSAIPLLKWGYFFPCQVAVWRYIHQRAPDLVDDFVGGYDEEPYYEGRGAEWFCQVWEDHDRYWELLEGLMRPLFDALPARVRQRGNVMPQEVPSLPTPLVEELTSLVEEAIRSARG
ncbi:MAG TPA: hypothetical protein VE153_09530 [Myxococcus sp.]|nr:hypothetical protein [Myxococcus sp.]